MGVKQNHMEKSLNLSLVLRGRISNMPYLMANVVGVSCHWFVQLHKEPADKPDSHVRQTPVTQDFSRGTHEHALVLLFVP